MKKLWTLLAALPLALSLTSLGQAGIFCGGCSDPCGAGASRGHGCCLLGGCFSGRSAGMSHRGYAGTYATASYGYGSYASASMGAGCGSYASSGLSYVGQSACGQNYGFVPSAATYGIPMTHGYGASYAAPQSANTGYSSVASMSMPVEQVSAPITTYQVSMQPTYVTETQWVAATDYQDETRYRVKKVYRSVPVQEQHYRMKTIMTAKTESKTIEYEVLIPETSQKTVDVTVSVPVWNEVAENYTIKVPTVVDVQETYTVKVPNLRDEPFTYTVQVPTPEKVMRTHTVTNSIPVTKTRTVQRQVPRTSMKTVQKDYGHWETVIDEVGSAAVSQPCSTSGPVVATGIVTMGGCGSANSYNSIGNCGTRAKRLSCGSTCGKSCGCGRSGVGCGSTQGGCGLSSGCGNGCGVAGSMGSGYRVVETGSCGIANATISIASQPMTQCGSGIVSAPATRSRQVWVPNIVNEEVPVIVNDTVNEEIAFTVYEQQSQQLQYEHTQIAYRPETRTGTKKVVDYVDEQRTRTRKQVEYRDETRTRVRKELSYKQEVKTETYPVVNYRTEKRTKDISFTVQVPEVQAEPYTTTRYEQIAEDVVEEYTIKVPVPSYREVQVQVCKMVPKLVPVTIQQPVVTTSVAPAYPTVRMIGGSQGAVYNGSSCGTGSCANVHAYPFIQSSCTAPGFHGQWAQPVCNGR